MITNCPASVDWGRKENSVMCDKIVIIVLAANAGKYISVIPSLESIIFNLELSFLSTNLEYLALVKGFDSREKLDAVKNDCIPVRTIPPTPGTIGGRFDVMLETEISILMMIC